MIPAQVRGRADNTCREADPFIDFALRAPFGKGNEQHDLDQPMISIPVLGFLFRSSARGVDARRLYTAEFDRSLR